MSPVDETIDDPRTATRRKGSANWTLLILYFFIVIGAMFGEMFTRFSVATFGYYYIMIGMPGWAVCWFALLICNEVRPLPKFMLYASISITVLAVIGYMNINP